MNSLTVNWHVTEKCNFKCHYCFARYAACDRQEVHTDRDMITALLARIHTSFTSVYGADTLRLNIAGGEPLLCRDLGFIIETAHKMGFAVSIITNASLITPAFVTKYAPLMSVFGISVDSLNPETNIRSGRCNSKYNLGLEDIQALAASLRKACPGINLKINTVVNAFNFDEDLSELIQTVCPDKWKVLQAISINTDRQFCTDEQFRHFLHTHRHLSHCIAHENSDLMINSYLMIDPYGRIYQNAAGNGSSYSYSPSLLDLTDRQAAQWLEVDMNKYHERYRPNRLPQ